MEIGLIVLAGGKSSRMGQDKAFLKLNEKTMVQHAIDKAKKYGFQNITVVTNSPGSYDQQDIRVVKDIFPGLGPLAGIHAGLTNSKFFYNFVIPCDMPFLSFRVLDELTKSIEGKHIVVPRWQECLQPLTAIYSKACIEKIEYLLLEKKEYKLLKLYDLLETGYVYMDFQDEIFLNVNTPGDFEEAKKYLRSEELKWKK